MDSRVEKYRYETDQDEPLSRYNKNKEIYNNLDVSELSRIKTNSNVQIIENSSKNIDINKIKKYIENKNDNDFVQRRVVVKEDINKMDSNNLFEEKRDYDINSVLEKAREKRDTYYEDEKYKKLRNTQYDILSKINISNDSVEKNESPEFNTDEKTLIDLINTITVNNKNKELLSELKGEESSEVTSPSNDETEDKFISEAIEQQKSVGNSNLASESKETLKPEEPKGEIKNLDKTFFTNSMSFSKEDFEGFEELEKSVKKNNVLVKVSIVFLILLAIVTVFVILKYVLNIF